MKQSLIKRLEHLEGRQAQAQRLEEERSGKLAAIHDAMAIGLALRVGGNAREELDAANGSLDLERRMKLTEQVAAARRIAATLTKQDQKVEPA